MALNLDQILWVQKNIEGRNYYTFEYILTSPNFARAAFATIAIGNGMIPVLSH